jgi:hypothetical protein
MGIVRKAAALRRAFRLHGAVVAASERLAGHYAPLHFDVVVPQTIIGMQGKRVVATLHLNSHEYDAWRLTVDAEVKYAEIKLVPELKALVLPQPSGFGDFRDVFLQVDATHFVDGPYTPIEIEQIIHLLRRLQPSNKQ